MYRYDDEVFETREQAEEYIRDNSLDAFRDVLDECSDRIVILGMHFLPSRVLEEVDPIAFNCEYGDFCNNLYEYIEEVDE